jgi:hypothetical protein
MSKYGEIINQQDIKLGVTTKLIKYKGFTYDVLMEKGNVISIELK